MKRPAVTETGSAGEPVTVVAVAASATLEQLRRILGHSRWTLVESNSLAQTRQLLGAKASVVLICDTKLGDGTWREVLDETLQLAEPPPVIVTAAQADEHLWMEVLNRGGYNLLGRPFQEQEVFRVISMAWLHRRERGQNTTRRAAG